MTKVPHDGRQAFALDLQTEYYAGSSIRNLAARHGLSYGTVHNLLDEAKTAMRPRGGRKGQRPQKAD